jgi:uncharacterized Zn-binding protein involved in type VI secretion
MPAAARTGDETSHAGTLATPPPGAPRVATVLIGEGPTAVPGNLHVCPVHAELGPANLVLPSPGAVANVVLVAGLPAARVGDQTTCGANILTGAPTVLIGDRR